MSSITQSKNREIIKDFSEAIRKRIVKDRMAPKEALIEFRDCASWLSPKPGKAGDITLKNFDR